MSPPLEAGTVTGPFLYFTFLCLALNSMAQPTGRICNMPHNLRFLLRSSPIFCFIDAAGIIALWIYCCLHDRNNSAKAAARIAHMRFKGVNDGNRENLAWVEKDRGFRSGVFLFGVAPQAVKLYGCRGVVWMQVVGAMYLVPWLVLELLAICAGRYRGNREFVTIYGDVEAQQDDKQRLDWAWIWKNGAIWAHCSVFSFYNLVRPGSGGSGFGIWILRIFVIGMTVVYMQILANEEYAKLNYTDPEQEGQEQGTGTEMKPSTVRAVSVYLLMMAGVALMCLDGFEKASGWLVWPLLVIWVVICVFFGAVTPLLNAYVSTVLVPLLYLTAYYNPKGTQKPDWLEYLG